MEIRKRICELEVGDRFDLGGFDYVVFNITDTEVHYYTPNKKIKHKLGRKSKQFVFKKLREATPVPVEMKRPEAEYSNSGHWDLIR